MNKFSPQNFILCNHIIQNYLTVAENWLAYIQCTSLEELSSWTYCGQHDYFSKFLWWAENCCKQKKFMWLIFGHSYD